MSSFGVVSLLLVHTKLRKEVRCSESKWRIFSFFFYFFFLFFLLIVSVWIVALVMVGIRLPSCEVHTNRQNLHIVHCLYGLFCWGVSSPQFFVFGFLPFLAVLPV